MPLPLSPDASTPLPLCQFSQVRSSLPHLLSNFRQVFSNGSDQLTSLNIVPLPFIYRRTDYMLVWSNGINVELCGPLGKTYFVSEGKWKIMKPLVSSSLEPITIILVHLENVKIIYKKGCTIKMYLKS